MGSMPSQLILPGGACPSNLRRLDAQGARPVTSDMYSICERIKEVSSSLYLIELHGGDEFQYAVMESCSDQIERLVFKVKRDALNGAVIEKLRRLLAMPLTERLKKLEAEEFKHEADRKEEEFERLYENLGRPLLHQMQHDGFATTQAVSYPKRGVVGAKGSKGKS